jgi:hypothetical protein
MININFQGWFLYDLVWVVEMFENKSKAINLHLASLRNFVLVCTLPLDIFGV